MNGLLWIHRSATILFPQIKWLPALCLVCAALNAHAQQFERIGNANGLEAQVVASLLIDRQGYLWVGSREGLFRYDGYQALSLPSQAEDPESISDDDIRFIYQANAGHLWISTNTGGLNRYDPVTGTFLRFLHDPSDVNSINDNNVYSIVEDRSGALWISTEKGVARMDSKLGEFQRFTHDPGNSGSLSHDRAYSLHRAENGDLWVATIGGGINRWDPDSNRFESFDLAAMANGISGLNDVFALQDASDGMLWAGTRAGLALVSTHSKSLQRVALGPCVNDICPVPALDVDDEGVLWAGSMDHGVYSVSPETGQATALISGSPGEPGNLPARPLLSLEVKGSQIFVGTWGEGVFRANLRSLPFKLIGSKLTGSLLTNETVTAVRATDDTGKPWIGSFGGGVQHLNVTEAEILHSVTEGDPAIHAGVLDLELSENGQHLAATSLGLITFGPDGATIRQDRHDPDQENSLGPGYIHAVLKQTNGDLWVGSGGNGLYRRRAGTEGFENFRHDPGNPDSLSGDFITALLFEGDEYLWIGTRSNGLNRCQIESWQCLRLNDNPKSNESTGPANVTDLFRSRNGRLWAASNSSGLYELVVEGRSGVRGLQRWTSDHGLLSNGVMAIVEDADESLWLSTRIGLSRLDPDTGRFINHVTTSGLPVSHFNVGAADSDRDFLYFGSTGGLLVIPKGSLLEPRLPSPVRATQIQTADTGEQLTSVPWDGSPLTMPYGQVLSLEFAVLDFSEASHEYEYRFASDEPWTGLGTRRVVTFFSLAPGRYQIQARGRDAYGLWGESEVVDLHVQPPFWMQAWFRMLIGVLLVLSALAIHRVRLSRERRIAREVRRLSEKRESALEAALGSEAELAVLTPRQKEIFQLLAEGYSAREIAELLNVSIKTVQAHRANLMERLELSDLAGLVRLAIRTGIVSPQDQ